MWSRPWELRKTMLLPFLAGQCGGFVDDLGDALAADAAATRVLHDVIVEPSRVVGTAQPVEMVDECFGEVRVACSPAVLSVQAAGVCRSPRTSSQVWATSAGVL